MRKNHVPAMEFAIKYKETGLPVNIEEILENEEQEWTNNLYSNIDGFYLGSDGQLILADECGNYAYVPREEKFIITVFIGTEMYEIIY